ncbi:uncharacterized protein LOC113211894 [Frankliniella occidentalis]|uniref:Uncharacterized protein LOC113211894 n=1 Tax=Frankliniella occidentalis TaxID=133901 RepID=A0A9C6XD77_FRAOC|nr:uncharacterized protein LOC113211894 [Frankliniella occidentalis]
MPGRDGRAGPAARSIRKAAPALAVLVCVLPAAVLALTTPRPSINSYAGPFNIMFREASPCPEGTVTPGALVVNLTGSIQHVRSVKYPVYNGQLLLTRDVVEGEFGVKVNIAKWDNVAGWKENFFRMDGNGGEYCKVVATIAKDAASEISRNNPKYPKNCPFPKGTYHFRNLSTELVQRYEHFPVFPYGRFRGDILFYEMKSKKKIVGCFSGVSDIVPKIKKS